jgi:hypothetical protein
MKRRRFSEKRVIAPTRRPAIGSGVSAWPSRSLGIGGDGARPRPRGEEATEHRETRKSLAGSAHRAVGCAAKHNPGGFVGEQCAGRPDSLCSVKRSCKGGDIGLNYFDTAAQIPSAVLLIGFAGILS